MDQILHNQGRRSIPNQLIRPNSSNYKSCGKVIFEAFGPRIILRTMATLRYLRLYLPLYMKFTCRQNATYPTANSVVKVSVAL
jgi:hypothetical protein